MKRKQYKKRYYKKHNAAILRRRDALGRFMVPTKPAHFKNMRSPARVSPTLPTFESIIRRSDVVPTDVSLIRKRPVIPPLNLGPKPMEVTVNPVRRTAIHNRRRKKGKKNLRETMTESLEPPSKALVINPDPHLSLKNIDFGMVPPSKWAIVYETHPRQLRKDARKGRGQMTLSQLLADTQKHISSLKSVEDILGGRQKKFSDLRPMVQQNFVEDVREHGYEMATDIYGRQEGLTKSKFPPEEMVMASSSQLGAIVERITERPTKPLPLTGINALTGKPEIPLLNKTVEDIGNGNFGNAIARIGNTVGKAFGNPFIGDAFTNRQPTPRDMIESE